MNELMNLLSRMVVALEKIAIAFGQTGARPNDPLLDQRGGLGGFKIGGEIDQYAPKFVGGPVKDVAGNGAERRKSTVEDVSYVTPAVVEQARAAQVTFAIDNLKVPWSEAHMRAVMEYEKLVERDYGQGASEQLPWRRVVPRGNEVGNQ